MMGLPQSAAAAPAPAASAAMEGILSLAGELRLHFGGALTDVRLAWRMVGAPGAPVVLALGGISAGRYVAAEDSPKSWWSEVVGPGRALDTERFRVLGMDFLGGSGETTGPQRGAADFPSISAYDQVELIRELLAHLGLPALHAVVGASYGGMVALALAERYPSKAAHIVVISAADRPHPMATAWRSVQRAVVRYAIDSGDGAEGLRLARALAMATYRSTREFEQRFSGPAERIEGRFRFPVEGYLLSRGDAYAARYVPEAFVCLSESIDLHQVDPSKIVTPATLIAVEEDQLVPLADMRALAAKLGGPKQLVEISSLYGHDAFLKEKAALTTVFGRALGLST